MSDAGVDKVTLSLPLVPSPKDSSRSACGKFSFLRPQVYPATLSLNIIVVPLMTKKFCTNMYVMKSMCHMQHAHVPSCMIKTMG